MSSAWGWTPSILTNGKQHVNSPYSRKWPVFIINLMVFKITVETHLWACPWGCFHKRLSGKGRGELNVDGTILWAGVINWIKKRKQGWEEGGQGGGLWIACGASRKFHNKEKNKRRLGLSPCFSSTQPQPHLGDMFRKHYMPNSTLGNLQHILQALRNHSKGSLFTLA